VQALVGRWEKALLGLRPSAKCLLVGERTELGTWVRRIADLRMSLGSGTRPIEPPLGGRLRVLPKSKARAIPTRREVCGIVGEFA
jgi:hypothetical protein